MHIEDSESSSIVFRSSLSQPANRSWISNSLHLNDVKKLHRKSLQSKTIVNKFVVDIRRSLSNTNLFKASNKPDHTNKIDRYVCNFFADNNIVFASIDQSLFFIEYPTTSINR